jgi:hypothetical protein
MAQLFHPSMNSFAKATVFGGLIALALIVWACGLWIRSPYATRAEVVRDQPVPFSHDHHTSGLGIDCRYCHTTVENSAFAGMPSTEVCMGCHSQIWKDSPLLAPVRASFQESKPLRWTRVHDLPDFVYFNHGIHVSRGVACESCHGRVDRMPLMRAEHSLHMEWCLDCHRHPHDSLRPADQVFAFGVAPQSRAEQDDNTADASSVSALQEAVSQVNQAQLADCAICHR